MNFKIYKRSSLGSNKVQIQYDYQGWFVGIVYNPKTKEVLWITDSWDLRKPKRRMRRAGWIR